MRSRVLQPLFATTFVLVLVACSHSSSSGTSDGGARSDARAPVNVLTQHNDTARTGVNPGETCLTPSVAPSLTQRAALPMDGLVFAQPLLLSGTHNLLILASTANELAAFDVDTLSTTPVWKLGQETFGIPGTVQVGPGPIGIISTPVIDPATHRLYVIARSCASTTATTNCPQTLHVIDAASGTHLDAAVASGSFTDEDGGVHPFNVDNQMNRPALLLQGGKVIAAWGVMTPDASARHEEDVIYHGTVMAFDVSNVHAPPIYYVATPHTLGGGIWQSGGGLAGDGTSVYFNTANMTLGLGVTPTAPTTFPATPRDQENSVVRLDLSGGSAKAASYFDDRAYHADGNVFQYTNFYDYDLSSSGVALIPGTNVLVAGSKAGVVYAVDVTTMKETQAPISAFRQLPLPAGQTLYIAADDDGPEILSSPVVWRRTQGTDDALLYMWARGDYLTSLHYAHATNTMAVQTVSTDLAGRSGGILSFSWDGTTNASAVLWASVSEGSGQGGEPSFIRAYDPTALTMLWQGNVPGYAKFSCPTIAGGRLYMTSWLSPTSSEVLVFGATACGT